MMKKKKYLIFPAEKLFAYERGLRMESTVSPTETSLATPNFAGESNSLVGVSILTSARSYSGSQSATTPRKV